MKNCFRTFSATGFPIFSAKGNNQKGNLFLQDEALSQKCKMSQEAMDKIACRLFRIPPRSPEGERCHQEEDQKRETYEHFCICVTNTLHNFSSDIIHQTIASMPKQIDAVIKIKGQHTKY